MPGVRLNDPVSRAYSRSGVDQDRAGRAVEALVGALRAIDTGRPSRTALESGHYASVLRLDDRVGLALAADGVGTKVIVAQELGRLDTIGVDCVAMNVNDVICVGADPIAFLDYLAVEEAEPASIEQLGRGLARGAEQAGVEIPGGELAVVPELLEGHPSPGGFDLVGFSVGLVALEEIVTGSRVEPGDVVLGLPSSGIHSNGLTLARKALPDLSETPPELAGRTAGEVLLEPTVIYVRAIRELLSSDVEVHGLAHITGEGLLNLLRLEAAVGFRIDSPLPRPPVFDLVAARAGVEEAELHEVFNLGCGFCCVVPPSQAERAVELLATHHPGTSVIGEATDRRDVVEVPPAGLTGRRGEGFGEPSSLSR